MRKVEYLRALDDQTWDTVIVDVPSKAEDPENGIDFDQGGSLDKALWDYADRVLAPLAQHRKVALFAVYNTDASGYADDD